MKKRKKWDPMMEPSGMPGDINVTPRRARGYIKTFEIEMVDVLLVTSAEMPEYLGVFASEAGRGYYKAAMLRCANVDTPQELWRDDLPNSLSHLGAPAGWRFAQFYLNKIFDRLGLHLNDEFELQDATRLLGGVMMLTDHARVALWGGNKENKILDMLPDDFGVYKSFRVAGDLKGGQQWHRGTFADCRASMSADVVEQSSHSPWWRVFASESECFLLMPGCLFETGPSHHTVKVTDDQAREMARTARAFPPPDD